MESQSSENSSSLNKGPIRSLLRHFLLALVVLMMVQVTISAYYMWKSETRSRQRSQVILDRLGHPLRHSFSDRGEKRNWQHLNELPPLLSQVFVASEDHRFFEHKGIDPLSLLRVVRDLLVDRQLRSGASTITMQLAKIYWPELKSKWHKGTQMLVALYLEQKMSKGDILSEYLNAVPFGFQRVGVGIACEFFFASSCSSLSPSQMAALAVIPRNPRHYTTNIEALLEMKNRLLIKLAHNIGKETLSLALKETVQLEFQPSEFIAPQFTRRIMAMNFDTEEVHSTLDYYLQREMQERFKNIVESTPKYGDSGALLIVDNRTHSVLVYIGSPDFFEPEIGQIDGVRAVRSPGSTMKPFLYAHAIENGYTLSDILPDIPMTFSIGQKVYEPSNYGGDYAGPVPIRRALANSKNIPALYLTNLLGAESVLESFKALGLSDTNLSGQHYGLGIAIGNLETTLWRLVQAYSVLANRGEYHPIAVLKGQTEPGYRLKDFETVSLITSVLSDHQSRSDDFGRGGFLETQHPVAVKTGTSNDFRDTWILSYSPDYTVGMWRGNASGAATEGQAPAAKALGPLLQVVWDRLYRYQQPKGFELSQKLKRVEVCPLSGKLAGPDCPSVGQEWFVSGGEPKESCKWHQHIDIEQCAGEQKRLVYVELPSEYREWLRSSELPTLESRHKEVCGKAYEGGRPLKTAVPDKPRIVEPLDQSVYAIDPSIPKDHQLLKVIHRGAQFGELKLIVNGQMVRQLKSESDEVFLPLVKGQHKMYLESQSGLRSEAVQYLVK